MKNKVIKNNYFLTCVLEFFREKSSDIVQICVCGIYHDFYHSGKKVNKYIIGLFREKLNSYMFNLLRVSHEIFLVHVDHEVYKRQ